MKRHTELKKKFQNYIPYIILLIMLVPVLCVSVYSRPVVDDFDYGEYTHAVVQSGGNIVSIIKAAIYTCYHVYMKFQGTYSSCFLMSLQPGIFNEKIYGITTWLLVLIIFSGFLVLFRGIKRNVIKDSKFSSIYWALLSTVVITLGMPSPAQGLYWYVGAMHYIPWMMLVVCNIGWVLDVYFCESKTRRYVCIALLLVSSFLISGGNQLTGFANILILSILLVIFGIKRHDYVLMVPLIIAVIGFGVMLFAPGNAVRQSVFNRPGVIKTIAMSGLYAVKWAVEWINGVTLAIIVLFIPLVLKMSKKIKESIVCKYPILTLGATAMVFCGMACVPFYAMGGFGEGRTINVLWMYFIIALIFNTICVCGWYENEKGINLSEQLNHKLKSTIIKTVIFLGGMVVIGLFSSGAIGEYSTTMKAVREWKNGELKTYARECDERIKKYHDPNVVDVVVTPLSEEPSLLYVNDIGENPNIWPNNIMAVYYNKNSIKIEEKE